MGKIAVIGTGYWGQNLVRNYHELGMLKTVCDINLNALLAMQKRYPGITVTRDYSEVLDDEDIHGVVIALPAVMHYEFAHKALETGKDVYVEKPLALHLDHAEKLINLAEKKGRVLMVGHLLHYHPAFIKLKEMAHGGELGKIQYIYSNRLSLGKIRREDQNPVARAFLRAYAPVIKWTLRRPVTVIALAGLILLATLLPVQRMIFGRPYVPFPQIGSEFMPPLNEGDMLYIPAGMPHLAANLSDGPLSAVIARTDPNEQESVRLLPELEGAVTA
jgi:hypothetical protein